MNGTAIALSKLAALVNGKHEGDEVTITGVNTVYEARDGEISFIDKEQLLPVGERSAASALIVSSKVRTAAKPLIVTEDPRLAFSKVLEIFAPERRIHPGVHPTAVLGSNCKIGENVSIGAHAFLGDNTAIEDNTVIHPLAYVGHEVIVGPDCEIHPQVYIGDRVIMGSRCTIHAGAVIGSDGFGYLQQPSGHRKIPQIGTVILENDVEIGANSTVDRATISATIIGAGTKLDDNVHVAHNCIIGKNCLFAGLVGIAGSTQIGDNVVLGGQVGVNDHIKVGSNIVIGAKSGIISDLDDEGVYSGFPVTDHRHQMRLVASTRRLPELLKQVRELEQRISELEQNMDKT